MDNSKINPMLSLFLPGQITELRALDVSTPGHKYPHTEGGYFDFKHLPQMLQFASKLSPYAKAVYFIPNPINPALLARCANRVKTVGQKDPRTSDKDILSLHWLLLDADPIRPADISSTDLEHEMSISRMKEIQSYLREQGWPQGILADSGNGSHGLYRIDLPLKDSALVSSALKALAFIFNGDGIKIDETVFNPSRIWKLYGTWSRKGDNVPERPHRVSRIIEIPEQIEIVPRKLLEDLAAKLPSDTKTSLRGQQNFSRPIREGKAIKIEAWIIEHGLDLIGPNPWEGGQRWIFRVCPWDESHTNRSAYLLRFPSGAVAAGCHHDSCSGKGWEDLKKLFPIEKRREENREREEEEGEGERPVTLGDTKVTLGNDRKPSRNKACDTIDAYDPAFSFLPDPPRFPIEVFPFRYRIALEQIASAYSTPIEVPAVALLTLAGACIGATRAIRAKRSWIEYPNLFMAIIGRSGIGKSPPIKRILSPVFRQEKKWFDEYKTAKAAYLAEIKGMKKGDVLPDPPTWMQLIVDDTTSEALTDALCASDRGILWNRDELSGLILDLDKYSGKEGGTKARLLSSYDCGPWKINRVGKDRCCFIPHAVLSIFGTIQPKSMATIFSDKDISTGFLQRFIFVRAERKNPSLWTDEEVNLQTDIIMENLIENLLLLKQTYDGKPIIIEMSEKAHSLYREWYDKQAIDSWNELDTTRNDSVLAKIRGQALRITLILHYFEVVANNAEEMLVSEETMHNAILLMDCFKEHQRQAWLFVNEKGIEISPVQRRVMGAILALKNKIERGFLKTSEITQEINQGMADIFLLSPDKVGRVLVSLGLERVHRKDFRGVSLTQEDLDKYENTLGSTSLVSPVPKTFNGNGFEPFSSVTHSVTSVTIDRPEPCQTLDRLALETPHFKCGKIAWEKSESGEFFCGICYPEKLVQEPGAASTQVPVRGE